ncbi:hypothetical protein K2173_014159 [Erythroxylum novogranatense]|uniref:Uncharacterized protein n=1 Tax=Erythroxylum novogranatense TaxID=1862640 RepID=A0AAV8SDY4_9ROSI|nr:hypothetical protein K2173_014159 [Erythroxylum novogranatense]
MPANEAEDSISSLHELGISSQGQYPSQAVGNKPSLDYSQWVGKSTRIASSPNLNLRNYILPELDSVARCGGKSSAALYHESIQLNSQHKYSSIPAINTPLNSNDLLVGSQNSLSKRSQPGVFGDITCYDQQVLTSRSLSGFKFQQEYECADSPTLTANSERSEITEASSDFHFYRGQQQLLRDQQKATSVAHPMQQSSYKDMQLLQQHMMFKQLQEFQRQQQLEKLGDVKQHNSLNQVCAVGKQAGGGHFSPLINGKPVPDASQMLQNWMQQGARPLAPGMPNKIMFPQEQFLAHRSMGMASQQLDLYGMPIANTTDSIGQHIPLLGRSHNSVNLAGCQVPKSAIHSSIVNSFVGDPSSVPIDLIGLSQGSLMAKQGFQDKDSGQIPVQSLNGGVFPGNLQEGNSQQANASPEEFDARHEQTSWPAIQKTAKQIGPSQGLVPLDPMEAKILYNMDDNIRDAFGSHHDMSIGGFGNVLEHADSLNAFPSVQCGSWSALMQSAVAEASSSDTGIQEEWSGLTFQNTDHSADNQISSFVDSEKHQTGWVVNNLQSTSFSSKRVPLITDSNMSSSFPGFEQPNIQLSIENREDASLGGSHVSIVNYNNHHKPSVDEVQKVQLFMNSENVWGGQIFGHNRSGEQLQRVALSDFSTDNKGHERLGKSQQQIDSEHNSHGRTNETNIEQTSSSQRENSSDFYISKRLSSHQQGSAGQFKVFDDVVGSSMTIDKGYLPDFQENNRAPEGGPTNHNQCSNIFEESTLHDGSNVTAQTGEHILELLQKVDQSRDDGSMQPFGSMVSNALPKMPGGDSCDTSVTQLYPQSSASQGFGLRLGPPSQRLPNSNNLISPQALLQNVGNLNYSPINPESLEKNQTYLGPSSSIQSLSSSHELSRRMLAVNRSPTSLQTGFSSNLNVQGNSLTSMTLDSLQTRNQFQTQSISEVPEKSQSWQVKLSSPVGKYSALTQSSTHYAHDQIPTKPFGERFPVLEASPMPQLNAISGSPQQSEILTKPHNVWRNVPSQRQPSGALTVKFPSTLSSSLDLSNNSLTSSSEAHHLSNDQECVRSGHKSLEFGGSSNFQSFGFGPGKEMLQQGTTPDIFDNSPSGGISQDQDHVSDAIVPTSASLTFHSQPHDLYRATNNVRELQHATGNQLDNNGSSSRQTLDSGLNAALQPNQSGVVDTRILSFLEVKDSQIARASSKSALLVGSCQDMVTFGHNDSQTQSSSRGLQSNHTNYSQVNLRVAPSWFKQYESLQNEQMVPMFDSGLAKTADSPFSLGKPSQDLHIQTSAEQLSAADADQGGRVWPNANTASIANQQLSVPYILPEETREQLAIIKPKKRKTISIEPLPWHKEVTQDSKRVRNISTSEEDWAQATNRLIEKVEDELIEEVQPVVRVKRRLVFTTQLMQQLFCLAPASFLSADAASNYDPISYLVSRLSLGDACSITYSKTGDLFEAVDYSNIYAEKLKVSERSDQQFLEVLDNFIGKAKKLEKDFQRLDKTSVVDVRLELKELEKFSVINRFAKFHVRGHMDASGILRPIPQRYFAALPSPKNLPDEAQCLSL